MASTRRQLLRQMWQPPRSFEEFDGERTVSFLELFYDLVYVSLIAAASHRLAHHLEWSEVAVFAVTFSLIWVAWLNGSAQYELHGREDVRTRLFVFVQMLLVALMTVWVNAGPDGRDRFAATYCVFMAVVGWLWFTARHRSGTQLRRATRPFMELLVATVVLMAVSMLVPSSAQMWVWAVTALAWIPSLFVLSRPGTQASQSSGVVSESLVERFGLFNIIVLGEVVFGVANGLSSSDQRFETFAVGLVSLGVGFGLWWNYFDLAGRRLPRQDRWSVSIWAAAHLPLTMSISAVGAVTVYLTEHASDGRVAAVASWVFCGATGITLVSLAAILSTLGDWDRHRRIYRATFVALMLAAVVAPAFGAWRPSPIILVAAVLSLLTLTWFVAVLRWLGTAVAAEPGR